MNPFVHEQDGEMRNIHRHLEYLNTLKPKCHCGCQDPEPARIKREVPHGSTDLRGGLKAVRNGLAARLVNGKDWIWEMHRRCGSDTCLCRKCCNETMERVAFFHRMEHTARQPYNRA